MKVITIICIILAVIAIIVLLLGLIAPKSYSIQREIIIHQNKAHIFDYLKHIKNQDKFSKWVMMDPQMKKMFTGTDGRVGFIYAWDGNKKAGAGEQEIKRIVEGNQLDIEVRFKRPFAGLAQTFFKTESESSQQTKVTWGMSSFMKYPMNMMLLFMNTEKLLGNDMESSLEMLKKNIESEIKPSV